MTRTRTRSTDNAIKNHWYSTMRRNMRKIHKEVSKEVEAARQAGDSTGSVDIGRVITQLAENDEDSFKRCYGILQRSLGDTAAPVSVEPDQVVASRLPRCVASAITKAAAAKRVSSGTASPADMAVVAGARSASATRRDRSRSVSRRKVRRDERNDDDNDDGDRNDDDDDDNDHRGGGDDDDGGEDDGDETDADDTGDRAAKRRALGRVASSGASARAQRVRSMRVDTATSLADGTMIPGIALDALNTPANLAINLTMIGQNVDPAAAALSFNPATLQIGGAGRSFLMDQSPARFDGTALLSSIPAVHPLATAPSHSMPPSGSQAMNVASISSAAAAIAGLPHSYLQRSGYGTVTPFFPADNFGMLASAAAAQGQGPPSSSTAGGVPTLISGMPASSVGHSLAPFAGNGMIYIPATSAGMNGAGRAPSGGGYYGGTGIDPSLFPHMPMTSESMAMVPSSSSSSSSSSSYYATAGSAASSSSANGVIATVGDEVRIGSSSSSSSSGTPLRSSPGASELSAAEALASSGSRRAAAAAAATLASGRANGGGFHVGASLSPLPAGSTAAAALSERRRPPMLNTAGAALVAVASGAASSGATAAPASSGLAMMPGTPAGLSDPSVGGIGPLGEPTPGGLLSTSGLLLTSTAGALGGGGGMSMSMGMGMNSVMGVGPQGTGGFFPAMSPQMQMQMQLQQSPSAGLMSATGPAGMAMGMDSVVASSSDPYTFNEDAAAHGSAGSNGGSGGGGGGGGGGSSSSAGMIDKRAFTIGSPIAVLHRGDGSATQSSSSS